MDDKEIYSKEERQSIFALARKFDKGDLVCESDDFADWGIQQSCRLIESIIMGIPLPAIYLYEQRNGVKHVLDGKKRLMSILDFLNNRFSLRFVSVLQEYKDFYFCDLPPYVQAKFEDCAISCVIFMPPLPDWIQADIYERLNANFVGFQAVISYNYVLRKRCATSAYINDIWSILCERYSEQSLQNYGVEPMWILRAISFVLLRHGDEFSPALIFRGDYRRFLFTVLKLANSSKNFVFEELKDDFLKGFDIWISMFDKSRIELGSNHSSSMRMVIFEMQLYIAMWSIHHYITELTTRLKDVQNSYMKERVPGTGRLDSASQIRVRMGIVDECLSK